MMREPVSIKIRVDSGCFHREHSPNAYRIIDEYVRSKRSRSFEHEYEFREHESGPEIIAYVALATAVIALASSIIDLIVTIIRARAEGIKRGDKPEAPLKLIARSAHREEGVKEKVIMEFSKTSAVNKVTIETNLNKAVMEVLEKRKAK